MMENTNVQIGSTMTYSGLKIKIMDEISTPKRNGQVSLFFLLVELYIFSLYQLMRANLRVHGAQLL